MKDETVSQTSGELEKRAADPADGSVKKTDPTSSVRSKLPNWLTENNGNLQEPPTWIYLIGFMGSGKSTLGPRLAARLHVPFIDTDELIVAYTGLDIDQIYDQKGEAYFRELEKRCILDPSSLGFTGNLKRAQQAKTDPNSSSLELTENLKKIEDSKEDPTPSSLGVPENLSRIQEAKTDQASTPSTQPTTDGEKMAHPYPSRRIPLAPWQAVVACGGGLAVQPGMMDLLKKLGCTIWLTAPLDHLQNRIEQAQRPHHRPLWYRNDLPTLQALLKARESIYGQAHLTLKTDHRDPDTLTQELYQRLTQPA